jgi:hypothetical protein
MAIHEFGLNRPDGKLLLWHDWPARAICRQYGLAAGGTPGRSFP